MKYHLTIHCCIGTWVPSRKLPWQELFGRWGECCKKIERNWFSVISCLNEPRTVGKSANILSLSCWVVLLMEQFYFSHPASTDLGTISKWRLHDTYSTWIVEDDCCGCGLLGVTSFAIREKKVFLCFSRDRERESSRHRPQCFLHDALHWRYLGRKHKGTHHKSENSIHDNRTRHHQGRSNSVPRPENHH